MTTLFDHFDAWEPLLKARKAKGLDKWDRLKNISEKLQGKSVKAISFTCSHPSHGGEPMRHLLGSVEGNLHFLLGYGNPKFHVAPYHWQIIDPNVTDEEAAEMSARMPHPANPVLWAKVGFDIGDEGDVDEGDPHEFQVPAKVAEKEVDREEGAITVQSAAGTYTCYPREGLVRGDHNGHVYTWDLVKDTFFTARHPEVVEAMEDAGTLKSLAGVSYRTEVPSQLRAYTAQFSGEPYVENVWSLVKSRMPTPGKIMKLESSTGETVYGVTTPTSLEFYDRAAGRASVRLFDREYDHFDLTHDGNVPPASLFSFLTKHFKINSAFLAEVASTANPQLTGVDFVTGAASPGWDTESAEGEDFVKSVVRDGSTLKVVRA